MPPNKNYAKLINLNLLFESFTFQMFVTKFVPFKSMNKSRENISQLYNKIRIILIILFLLMVLSKDIITYSAFKINQDFIAKVLCINKDKPILGCEGNCHLNKELKKNNSEDRESKTNFPVVKQEQKINLFSNRLYSNSQGFGYTRQQFCDIDILQKYLMTTDIFHPPRIHSV